MALSLKKGEGVSLRKEENDLAQVTICLLYTSPSPRD